MRCCTNQEPGLFTAVSTGTFCLQWQLHGLQQNTSYCLCNVSPNKAKCPNFDTVFYKFLTNEYYVPSKFLTIYYSHKYVSFCFVQDNKKEKPSTVYKLLIPTTVHFLAQFSNSLKSLLTSISALNTKR